MGTTTDRLDREMRAHGRVVIGTRRWKVGLLAVLGAVMTVPALLLALVPEVDPGPRVVGGLLALVLGTITVLCAWRAVTGRPALVVDTEGIRVGARRAAWSEIDRFSVAYVRATAIAVVHGRNGHAPLAARNPALRWMARKGGSTLPNSLEVRPTPLVDWLSRQLRHRG